MGEKMAARYLRKNGYRVLMHGWKAFGCEVDLVAEDPHGELVFVEVKTRRSLQAGNPEDSVTPTKRQHLEQAAQGWFDAHHSRQPWRVDVIAIELGVRTHILHFEGI